jgi:signal peptidase I
MDPISSFWKRILAVRGFLLRTALFAALAYAVFGWLLVPVTVRAPDMAPSYKPGDLTFCFRPARWFGKARRGDVVFVVGPSGRGLLLRRVVALAGDSVGFAQGRLVVNGAVVDEPYVARAGTWTLPLAVVREKCVFLVGDDRGTPLETTLLGEAPATCILGAAVW